MDERFQRETLNLERSWMQHDQEMLREYLVAGVEDPKINVQSILTRHCLITALFGTRFARVMEEELRFATVLNWAAVILKEIAGDEDLRAIQHALRHGAEDAEGIPVPRFVSSAYQSLPLDLEGVVILNYIARLFAQPIPVTTGPCSDPGAAGVFQELWRKVLTTQPKARLSVLELACGSANDYRCFSSSGLAPLLDYTGLDLCEKNICNARQMFPEVAFAVGNALDIPAADQSVDYTIAHDLFEHLSIAAFEQALAEMCRVTRLGLCLGLFNAHEWDDHVVQPVEDYHWNRLSVPRLKRLLEKQRFQPRIIHIDTFLKWHFGCADTHNKNAYTILAERLLPS